MRSRKFKFPAQPALDKAMARQKTCEQAVVDARRALEEEKKLLQRLMDELEEIRQQIRELYDNLVSESRSVSDPRELRRVSQSIEALKRKEEHQKLKIGRQQEQVAWAADKVELRKRELAEAMAHVQSLERLKEKRRKEHELAVQKAEESRRDDDAIQLWNSKRSNE